MSKRGRMVIPVCILQKNEQVLMYLPHLSSMQVQNAIPSEVVNSHKQIIDSYIKRNLLLVALLEFAHQFVSEMSGRLNPALYRMHEL